jgi:hypothetical protein
VIRIGTEDGKKVADAMKLGIWDSVLGPLSFNSKGDVGGIGWTIYKWDKTANYAEIGSQDQYQSGPSAFPTRKGVEQRP